MQKTRRYIPRNINGILLLNKPKGLSSNQALQKVKHQFQAKKAGHTGSLDPLATGMLPICLGEATKFSHFLLDADKAYQTTAKLGIATSTGDMEGEVAITKNIPLLSELMIQTVLKIFLGEIIQTPPMYSALKHQGQPLYKLARQGINIEPKKRTVTISAIRLLSFTKDTFTMEVHCSKGTYIRSLVEDIAKALNTVGYVQALERLWVHPFESEKQYSLEELGDFPDLDNLLLPMDFALQSLPTIQLNSTDVKKLQQGQSILIPSQRQDILFRLYTNDNQFLGVGEIKTGDLLCPKRLVNF